ncbi:MAG: hypothetical protein AAB381_00790 [Patescibacteria group bacterium]
MPLTRTTTRYIIRTIGISLIVLIVGGYAVWRSLDYVRGPEITIFEPTQYATLATSTVIIRGDTQRINELFFNGTPIAINEDGAFGIISTVFSGINIYTFMAQDSFGRKTSTEIRIVGTVDLPAPAPTPVSKPEIRISTTSESMI